MKAVSVSFYRKHRTFIVVLGVVLLGTVIIWAASDLVGAANSKAQQSGMSSTETQVAAFDSMPSSESQQKKPSAPQGDWATVNKNEKRIKAIDAEYLKIAESAQTAKTSQGPLPADSVTKLNTLAAEYVDLQTQSATAWDGMKPVCKTRAKTCRDLAAARKSSNEVLVADARDSKKLEQMKKDEDAMAKSHTEYTKSDEARDIAPDEKTRINQKVVPGIDTSLQKVAGLISDITALISEAQSVASGVSDAKSNPLGAINALKKGGGLVGELKSLLGIVTGTQKNLKTIKGNAQSLAK